MKNYSNLIKYTSTKDLGELCDIFGGIAAPKDEESFKDGSIPFVKMQDLGRYHLTKNLTNTKEQLNKEYVIKKGFRIFPKGSILLPRSGSVHLNHRAILGVDACIVSHIAVLINKAPTIISTEFLYHVLASYDMKKIMSQTTGLNMITFENLKKIKIPILSLPVQRRIVSILERAEQTKQMRAEADELTNKFLQAVFLEMFGDPIKNPKKWDKKKLKVFGKILTGNTPSRKIAEYYGAHIDWIKSDNVNTPHTYLTKSEEMLSEEGAKVARIVPKRSILVTCIAGSLSCIGNVAIADRNVAFNQQINAIIPNDDVNELFMYHLILNTKKYIQKFSTKSMKGMLSKSVFESIPLIYTPRPLQQKFASIVEKVEAMRANQKSSKQEIENLFGALMQKAFRGELAA